MNQDDKKQFRAGVRRGTARAKGVTDEIERLKAQVETLQEDARDREELLRAVEGFHAKEQAAIRTIRARIKTWKEDQQAPDVGEIVDLMEEFDETLATVDEEDLADKAAAANEAAKER